MKIRHLPVALMLVSGLVVFPSSAYAAIIAFRIDVEVDSGSGFFSAGTAVAGGGILRVIVDGGETIRFTVGIASAAASNLRSYTTTVNADDPGEADYIAGSGLDLSGLAFGVINSALLADPDTQLNDGTPGVGNINSLVGSTPGSNIDFYQVDYIFLSRDADLTTDFSVKGIFSTMSGTDSSAGGVPRVSLSSPMPDPASMLLLGSGLAALAGFCRRRKPP